ncbi:ArdC-like ssDNA-binding domain-containing protein [Actinomadura madurae]|uniref:ArdC-like ssDNA-binding domain-containing protein n=1 Tax=Actinomadura madurae TaxID=1993 RepID=UPI0020269111|nr:ArdC-like ssDNA-binding domain-containing protein [Actinomadura madurae]URM97402.1 ArdC-like ssDNA-binding domain-containing protein [Actinomadura madurae]
MTSSPEDEPLAQAEAQRRRLDVLRGIADHTVSRLVDGSLRWDAWLEHATHHGRYGFTNTLLIPAQRPAATDVRSYDAWQKQGRQVRRGESGIRIISTRGRPRTVFDIAQTDGQPIDKPRLAPAEALRRLSQLVASLGYYLDRGQDWTYLGRPASRIHVAPELDDLSAASQLAHQLAHVLRPGGHMDTDGVQSASCRGVRRVMADSVAHLVLADMGLPTSHLSFPPTQQWAGTDTRTDSAAAIRAMGDLIVRTSTRIRRRLTEAAVTGSGPVVGASATFTGTRRPPDSSRAGEPAHRPSVTTAGSLRAALADAHRFYLQKLPGSWGAHYLTGRGVTPEMQQQWELGLAPRGRHSLLRHLRELGHGDQILVEAGLVKRRENGDLLDLFRDRVLFPLRDRNGEIVGFIGRRRDEANGPKYLNTPETDLFHKSDVLFGLYEVRDRLGRRARPLLVEGPLDAIADYAASGLVIALDGDRAGQAGAIRAWRLLRDVTGPVDAAVLPQGRDPAELLSAAGCSSVHEVLLSVTPLADLVIDEKIHRFGGALEFVESRVSAARAAATLIAELQPDQIGRQVTRVAARTGMDPAEITALVASAISPDSDSAASLPPPPARGPGPRSESPRARTPSQRPNPHRRTV